MTSSEQAATIEHRNRLSYAEFFDEFLLPRRALVITGALDEWKALSKWSPQYFKEAYGSVPLQITGQHHTLSGFLPRKDGNPLNMSEFIEMVLSSTDENPAPYLRNVWIEKFLPELDYDLQPLPSYLFPNWLEGPLSRPLHTRLHAGHPELYIGGRGGRFPILHYDSWHIHTFLCQIYGVKEYIIFPPDQGGCLYPDGHSSSIRDIDNVDLEKYPLFREATPIRFELRAGEILFVPAGWWHVARIRTPSITVSLSRVNSSNWHEFARDLRLGAPALLRPLVFAYLSGCQVVRKLNGSSKTY